MKLSLIVEGQPKVLSCIDRQRGECAYELFVEHCAADMYRGSDDGKSFVVSPGVWKRWEAVFSDITRASEIEHSVARNAGPDKLAVLLSLSAAFKGASIDKYALMRKLLAIECAEYITAGNRGIAPEAREAYDKMMKFLFTKTGLYWTSGSLFNTNSIHFVFRHVLDYEHKNRRKPSDVLVAIAGYLVHKMVLDGSTLGSSVVSQLPAIAATDHSLEVTRLAVLINWCFDKIFWLVRGLAARYIDTDTYDAVQANPSVKNLRALSDGLGECSRHVHDSDESYNLLAASNIFKSMGDGLDEMVTSRVTSVVSFGRALYFTAGLSKARDDTGAFGWNDLGPGQLVQRVINVRY